MDIIWTSFGHHLDIIWISFGDRLGIIWRRFKDHLGITWGACSEKLMAGGPGGRSPPGKQDGLGGRQAPQWVSEITFHKQIFLFVDIFVEYLLQGIPIIVHFFT